MPEWLEDWLDALSLCVLMAGLYFIFNLIDMAQRAPQITL